MAGEEIVIRDDKGTDHVFPAGFDKQKAIEIVRKSAQPTQREPLVTPMGAPNRQAVVSDFAPAPVAHPVLDALDSAAHPKTLGDFLNLLIPSELAALKAGSKAASVADTVKAIATSPNRPTMREVAVGASKGLAEAIKSPEKSIAGTAIGAMVGGPEGAGIGAALSAIPKMFEGVKAEVVARTLREIEKVPSIPEFVSALRGAGKARSVNFTANDINRILSNLPEQATKVGGSIIGKSTRANPLTVPVPIATRSGPMIATLPDKWGVSTITLKDVLGLPK